MIKHVVMWRLHDRAQDASKGENALEIKRRLEALPGSIPCLRMLEVGLNFAEGEAAWDVVLVTGCDTREDLDSYRVHPAHRSVAGFLSQVCADRRVVDYEVA